MEGDIVLRKYELVSERKHGDSLIGFVKSVLIGLKILFFNWKVLGCVLE